MDPTKQKLKEWLVCKTMFAARDLVPGLAVRDFVFEKIKAEFANWSESFICRADLNKYRTRYVHSLLESEIKRTHLA